MGLTTSFSAPFYVGAPGAGASTEVPGRFHVALGGRGFMVDFAKGEFRRESIALLRDQADQSVEPGEASVNPDDLWRRTASSWHQGAGQRNFDGAESDPHRFYTSKGVDPWTKGELNLLPAVDEKKTSANTNLFLAVAGSYLYLTDGGSIVYTTDITPGTPTWSNITGEPGTAATGLTSDGYTLYSSHGNDGIYVTTRGAASTAKGVTAGAVTLTGIRYLKGRLFTWAGTKLYNVTTIDTGTPAALPTTLLDHPNTDWAWVDVAEAAGHYFAAGYSGDRSLIYSTAVQEDGTGLDVPMVAAELPKGEVVLSVYGYLGFILIGTNLGIRFATPDTTGQLTLGALIDEVTNVRCFEGQSRFVWFGWSQYDSTSTGLGRLDLSAFNGLRPAFASDLMATEDGNVLSVATFQGRRVFTASGDGVFAEDDALVASGTIETGRITYGIYDPKVSLFLTVTHEPLVGTLVAELSRDGGDYAVIGSTSEALGSVRSDWATGRARAESFDLRITLTGDDDEGPVVGRLTLRSYPAGARSERIFVPLLLGKSTKDLTGSTLGRDTQDDLRYLAALEAAGQPFIYQEPGSSDVVVAEDHQWLPHHLDDGGTGFAGTYVIAVKRFATE